MKTEYRVSPGNPTLSVNLGYNADGMAVMNNTPYPVVVRRGAQEIPNEFNYDYFIPAGGMTNLPVVGSEFGFRLTSPVVVSPDDYAIPVMIIFYKDEIAPAFSNQLFINRSVVEFNLPISSSYQQIIETVNARFFSFNVSIDNVAVPNAFSITGYVVIEQSNDAVVWSRYKQYNMYPVSSGRKQVSDILPSPLRFIRVTVSNTSTLIAWDLELSYALTDFSGPIAKNPFTVWYGNTTMPANSSIFYANQSRSGGILRALYVALNVFSADEPNIAFIVKTAFDQNPAGFERYYSFGFGEALSAVSAYGVINSVLNFSGRSTEYMISRASIGGVIVLQYRIPLDIAFTKDVTLWIENGPLAISATVRAQMEFNE
ncbi:MAG: hypothetical protein WC734_06100 [Patescibacteria group bacterium]|jgi:hypothetical protein